MSDNVSRYTSSPEEDKRLRMQNEVLESFDGDVYEEIFARRAGYVLDVGCGTGDFLSEKLKGLKNLRYLGADKNEGQIRKARERHPDAVFETLDADADSFAGNLQTLMDKNGVKNFSVIHLSMVLLHLVHPERLLKILKSFLAEDGILLVREIDDGLNFASPDPEKWFSRLFEIGKRDDKTGNRFCGRTVYPMLVRGGYHDIRIRKQGFSTAGMTPEQKKTYFNMTFKFILDDEEYMANKFPGNRKIQKDLEWSEKNREEILRRFLQDDFIVSLGFMTFTAKK